MVRRLSASLQARRNTWNVSTQTSRPVEGEPSGRPNVREAPIQERGNIPMNERRQIDPRNENLLLARWLQQVMAADSTSTGTAASPAKIMNTILTFINSCQTS